MATKTARLLKSHVSPSDQSQSVMARLLSNKSVKPSGLVKGSNIEGLITKLTRQEILVDIQAKALASVMERDKRLLNTLLTTLKVGDKVTVSVLNPESDNGNPVVSLRRFLEGRSWGELEKLHKDHVFVKGTVTESTKGGFVVQLDSGVSAFLPYSYTISTSGQLTSGDVVSVTILELKRTEGKVIVSQKPTLTDTDIVGLKKQYKAKTSLTVSINTITPFGLFVTLPLGDKGLTIDGLIHISEVSWEKVDDLASRYKQGDNVEVVVIGFDETAKRVDLSIKRKTDDPFTIISKDYPVDKKIQGTVTKITDGNVYVAINSPQNAKSSELQRQAVEGIIKKEKVPPTVTFTVGQEISATVIGTDSRRRRLDLAPVLLEKPIGYR